MDRFYFKKKNIVLFVLCTFCCKNLYAATGVNVIAWWNYIDSSIKEEIEKDCNAQIYIDEYYSNPEFLRRSKSQNHDIAIYSDTVYSTFIKETKTSSIDIGSDLILNYIDPLHEQYLRADYLPNTVYYQFALTGFLWNPKVIQIDKQDSIEYIFKKAGHNTVIVLDEHVEIMNLLSKISPRNEQADDDSVMEKIQNLFKESDTVVSNALGKLVLRPNFAFAYTWSGEALKQMQSTAPNLEFLVHPQLSHWSKDLLTLVSDKSAAACVAKGLAGKKHLNKLATNSLYFSPFGNNYKISQKYNQLYNLFVESLQKLEPLKKLSPAEYRQLDLEWQEIKMNI